MGEWIETTVGEQATLQRGIDITKSEQRVGVVSCSITLAKIAHVEPLAAAGAFHEMIGLGLSDALGVNVGL